MNCEQTQHLLDAYLDGELDLIRNLEIDQHLQDCEACSAVYKNLQTLQTAMTSGGLYFQAPPALKARIQQSLRQNGKAKFSQQVSRRTLALPRRWMSIAAVLLVAVVALGLFRIVSMPSLDSSLAQEVVSSHVRSLMVSHLADVESTDQHTVKPWFDGKLNFSPPVIDLANQGFPLTGGRLDYLDNRPVAALVYQRHKHIINLFVWPMTDDTHDKINSTTQQGWQILHWTQAGMTFWAVSDVNSSDLQNFAQLIQGDLLLSTTP